MDAEACLRSIIRNASAFSAGPCQKSHADGWLAVLPPKDAFSEPVCRCAHRSNACQGLRQWVLGHPLMCSTYSKAMFASDKFCDSVSVTMRETGRMWRVKQAGASCGYCPLGCDTAIAKAMSPTVVESANL